MKPGRAERQGQSIELEGVVFTMRRFLLIPVAGLFWTSLAAAQSIYQIDLRDHAAYLSEDRPVERGLVVRGGHR